MQQLRMGVLGISNHFLKRIILPVSKLDKVSIEAIASRDAVKAADFASSWSIGKHYSSYEDLLADKDIDAVYIPLPNHLHAQWISKAAAAGKHILCEKPLCMTAAETEAAVAICQQNNVLLQEAFMYKYHPQWRKVQEIIRTNNIGSIQSIHTVFTYNNASPTNIRNIKEYGGGALRDIGCYAVSVPRFLLGKEPQRVMGMLNIHPQFETDCLSSALLDFGTAHASFSVATGAQAFQQVDILASSGRITVHLPFNSHHDVAAKVTVDAANGTRDVFLDPVDQYGLMFDAFADCLSSREDFLVQDNDAVLNQKVLDALFRSAQSQAWESPG
ncbi:MULTISPECIES: Gfo/Idh/MocA family protein [unclassified Carboxylicivirga]|uniref:Gfo/Idh/MocA family protein n=1 Tax=Carboxylicivirga TaxID=1628153 RepID=UPI003D327345